MTIKVLLSAALFLASHAAASAQTRRTAASSPPQAVVRSLYKAHDAGAGPFFQTKSRALLDRYFTKRFADLLWQDAVDANGEVGALDFDPLYNAQDVRIRAFKIGRPIYDRRKRDEANVPVTFKNMGHAETILFMLERDGRGVWKIGDIAYASRGELLTARLVEASNAARNSEARADSPIRKVDFKNFDYGPLCAGEHKFFAPPVETLVLKDGHQQQGDELNYANLGSVEYVDFDGDGGEEAFVVVKGQTAGSSNRYLAAYVYAYRDGGARRIWSRCEEGSLAELKGTSIVFKRPEWVGGDAHCCFSYVRTETYGWKGSRLALISSRRAKSGGR